MADAISVGSLMMLRGGTVGVDADLLAGAAGLDRRITIPYVQKTGLALAGFHEHLQPGRVLIFGESEVRFLERMTDASRVRTLRQLFERDFPCILLTKGLDGPAELAVEAEHAGVPLLRTALATPLAIARLTHALEDELAPRELRHGVLLDVLGLGILLTGESGIGKSECAIDLVVRGHRLVADDVVEIRCRSGSVLIGQCPEQTRHHVEIRGLGIVNVPELFGASATRSSKRVEFVVHFERWDTTREYDRLGLDSQTLEILGIHVPLVTIPVTSARNLAMLVEVAARNQLLRFRGRHAAQVLVSRLEARLQALGDRDDQEDLS